MVSVYRGTPIVTRFLSVVGIIVILVFGATFYIKQRVVEVSTFGSWITLALYFAGVATTIYILRTHFYRIKDRRPRYHTSVLLFVVFFGFLIWKLLGLPGFGDYYSIIVAVGGSGVHTLVAYSYLSSMFRFRTNTWEKTVMAITAAICLVTISPLLPLAFPGSEKAAVWLLNYPGTAVTNALWTTTYLGLAALLTRVFIGKEKLSAVGG